MRLRSGSVWHLPRQVLAMPSSSVSDRRADVRRALSVATDQRLTRVSPRRGWEPRRVLLGDRGRRWGGTHLLTPPPSPIRRHHRRLAPTTREVSAPCNFEAVTP